MTGNESISGGGWHPDPHGRHQLRFWDGRAWTAHVSNAGVPGTDPLTPGAPPATAAAHPVSPALKNRLYLLFGAAGLVILGCLLPWASQNNGLTTDTISGVSRGGGVVCALLAAVILVIGVMFLNGSLGRRTQLATLVLGTLGLVVAIANAANISDVMQQERDEYGSLGGTFGVDIGTKMGIGLVLVLVAWIAVLVVGVLTLRASRTSAAVPAATGPAATGPGGTPPPFPGPTPT